MKNRSAFVRGFQLACMRGSRAQSAAFLPDFQRHHLEPRPALRTRLANLGIIAVLEESIHATNTIEPNANSLFCGGVRRHLPDSCGWNPLRQSGRFPQL